MSSSPHHRGGPARVLTRFGMKASQTPRFEQDDADLPPFQVWCSSRLFFPGRTTGGARSQFRHDFSDQTSSNRNPPAACSACLVLNPCEAQAMPQIRVLHEVIVSVGSFRLSSRPCPGWGSLGIAAMAGIEISRVSHKLNCNHRGRSLQLRVLIRQRNET